MNRRSLFLGALVALVLLVGSLRLAQARSLLPAESISTAFTYQGYLTQNGQPANGTFDFQFRLYDAATGGNQVGDTLTLEGVEVVQGVFTVQLDFGDNVFNGQALWLEVSVKNQNSEDYVALTPRQALTTTPYAIYSLHAPWSGLTGVPAGFADGVDNDTTYTAGTGLVLSGGAFSLASSYQLPQGCANGQIPSWDGSQWVCADNQGSSGGWSLTGNAGTDPSTNFLGTTDNQPLVVKVNGWRAFLIEPTDADNAPNIIGGWSSNSVADGVKGATIAGGGAKMGNPYPNQVTADFGTVGGGFGNTAGWAATVAGGLGNTASGSDATVGGGVTNTASGSFATIGGGDHNTASGNDATVAGGDTNTASGNRAAVGGGEDNQASGPHATVAGGWTNHATGDLATVAGGAYNTASGKGAFVGGGGWDGSNHDGNEAQATASTIAGGYHNTIQQSTDEDSGSTIAADYATIAGGKDNTIQADATSDPDNPVAAQYAAIAGGEANSVAASADHAFVGGGYSNLANGKASTVAGGWDSTASGDYATMSGGRENTAGDDYAAVGGGYQNTASGSDATVGGGSQNTASGSDATVAGGESNTASGWDATVGGGISNTASGSRAAVGGGGWNTASGEYGTVAGGLGNVASGAGAFVGGGGWNGSDDNGNWAQAAASTIAGGYHNAIQQSTDEDSGTTIAADYATIAGGKDNTIQADATTDPDNPIAAQYAAIAGGEGNTITAHGNHAFIGSGKNNAASKAESVVVGGDSNTASNTTAFVGAGAANTASGVQAAVVAGGANIASGTGAFVGAGGYDGTNWDRNTASGTVSVVGGGMGNTSSGYAAVVAGGKWNNAHGNYSIVPGGYANTAAGNYSFAAGRRAKANNQGCFVWGDSTDANVTCNADDRTIFRSSGGFYIYTSSDLSTGVYLPSGANSWTAVSDRATKENFTPVDEENLLERLAAMPVREYHIKNQAPNIRHIGPVAQDFYATFGYGETNRGINMEDAVGVSFAAIQGLYAENQQLKAENAALKAQLANQQKQLDRLADRVSALERGGSPASPVSSGLLPGAVVLLLGIALLLKQQRKEG